MKKLISEETLLEFNKLSEKIARHKRLMEEASDKWSKKYFEVTKKFLDGKCSLDEVQFLKTIKLPEDFDR